MAIKLCTRTALPLLLVVALVATMEAAATTKGDAESAAPHHEEAGAAGEDQPSESWATWAKEKVSGETGKTAGEKAKETAPNVDAAKEKSKFEKVAEVVSQVQDAVMDRVTRTTEAVKEASYPTTETYPAEPAKETTGAAKEEVVGGSQTREEEL